MRSCLNCLVKQELTEWLEQDLMERFRDRIVPLDIQVLLCWGELAARLEISGKPMPAIDSLIAATALQGEYVLVTRNTSDFEYAGYSHPQSLDINVKALRVVLTLRVFSSVLFPQIFHRLHKALPVRAKGLPTRISQSQAGVWTSADEALLNLQIACLIQLAQVRRKVAPGQAGLVHYEGEVSAINDI